MRLTGPLAALSVSGVVALGAAAVWAFVLVPEAEREAAVVEARAEAAQHPSVEPIAPPTPGLPFPVEIAAEFDLINQDGERVTEADFSGTPMAIFFGYANCEAICSVALPRLGEALDLLGEDVGGIWPLVITVDPARDTPENIGPALAKWHPRLRGLTGSEDALAAAREAFQVQSEKVFDDPEGNPVYSHGSFIYLIGGDGKVLTIMPPILGPERMAEIMRSYL